MSDDTLLLLNRALLVMQTMRASAHELNNVFQMISGSAELLELNPAFPAAMRPKLETIARHTGRGRTLVGAVADLARAQPPRASVADVKKTVERVAQLRNYEHIRSGIECVVKISSTDPLVVRVDAFDLQVMLLNLVIDAEQALASPPLKQITISAERQSTVARIIVAATAPAIAHPEPDVSSLLAMDASLSVLGLAVAATNLLVSRSGGVLERRQGAPGWEAVLTFSI